MPTFKLNAHITVSAYTEVDADTLEEAIGISRDREIVLCPDAPSQHQNSPEEFWIVQEADGSPQEITEE